MFAIAFYAGPLVQVNGQGLVPSQWGANGAVSGWASKATTLYLVPIVAAIFYLAFMLLPSLGIYRREAEHFAGQFHGFKVIFVFVMGVIYVAMLLPALGIGGGIDPMYVVVPAISLIFFYVGYMLNFTHGAIAGISEGKGMASEKLWASTNRFGSRLFWLCGALILASLVAPADARIWWLLLPLIFCALALFAYSVLEYKKACRAHLAPSANAARAKRKGKKK